MEFRQLTQEEIDHEAALEEEFGIKPNYDENNPPPHTGLFFRGYNQVYWTGTDFAQKKGYRKLKRKSCKGCPVCDEIDTIMREGYAADTTELLDIKNGKLYEMILRIIPGPYEYPNDIDVELDLIEVKE